jgi:hypothetical protein
MKTWKHIITLSLFALLGSPSVMPTNAAERPAIRQGKNPPMDVTRINPSKGDLRKAKHRQQDVPDQEVQVHAVRLHVDMPPAGGEAYLLYIGDALVQEYGSFSDGIFFKVYDPKELQLWRGKPVRFVAKNEVIELGVTFPQRSNERRPGALPELEELLNGN